MEILTLEMLTDAARAGGASALSSITELMPAGGPQELVAPAKYKYGTGSDKKATYVFEHRYVDGVPVNTVLIDSRTSMANRVEYGLKQGIAEGNAVLSNMPKICVRYKSRVEGESDIVETDLDLPHRAFDGHIRLGFDDDGKSIVDNPQYRAARNATCANAMDLLMVSPITLVLGGWDSTGRPLARFASCLTGEITGVLSNQEQDPSDLVRHRSGARLDPISAKIYFDRDVAASLLDRIGLDSSLKDEKGSAKISGSHAGLGIGNVPPGVSADSLDGISVSRIIRSHVLSFATLRSLSFGKGSEGDAAIRTLLSAIAIDGMARVDGELQLRANCYLVERSEPKTTIHLRYGEKSELAAISVEQADELMARAYELAHDVAGISWQGQTLKVIGCDKVLDAIDSSVKE